MKAFPQIFFIGFTYDHYCQGYEDAYVERLVHAFTLQGAYGKIEQMTHEYRNARNFEDLTIY